MSWDISICNSFFCPSPPVVAVRKRKHRQQDGEDIPLIFDEEDVHHHQACAVVEQLIDIERQNSIPNTQLGESDILMQKSIHEIDKKLSATTTGMPSTPPQKWKLGLKLTEIDQLKVLLTDNSDRFAYKIEELERYTGPPMEIKINSTKDIFRPPHKLGEKEWAFFGEQCEKLEKMGL